MGTRRGSIRSIISGERRRRARSSSPGSLKPAGMPALRGKKKRRILQEFAAGGDLRSDPGGSRSYWHPIEAYLAASHVMEFHIGPAAGIGGDRSPNRAVETGGALDEVMLAGDAGPVNNAILTLLSHRLIGRYPQNRLRIGWVGAGDVFVPVAGAIAVRIGSGLREDIVNRAEVTEPPGVGDTVAIDGGGAIGQENQAREGLLGE